jgi:hypothetical protein
MKLLTVEYHFRLLTPCFSGTALGQDGLAEMRVPAIRGHIRFWHREQFDTASANRIWGSTSGNNGQASRIAVRLASGVATSKTPAPLLPHKPSDPGYRAALSTNDVFTFHLQRLVSCTNADWKQADVATQLWLLVGCLGLRSNRGAGSVWPMGQWVPKTANDLKQFMNRSGFRWAVALVGEGSGKPPDELRQTASDTIRGNPVQDIFGGINPRQSSPTKFKIIRLNNDYCILAIAPKQEILQSAERHLKSKHKAERWQALVLLC